MSNIKQTIDDNIYQNGQQKIRGDILNNVLKAMVDDYDIKIGDLSSLETIEKSSIVGAINEVISKMVNINTDTGVLTYMGVRFQLVKIIETSANTAICGNAICGLAICGNE